jgi:serine/threonine protein kinase
MRRADRPNRPGEGGTMLKQGKPVRRQHTTKLSASIATSALTGANQKGLGEPVVDAPVIAGYHIDRIIGEGGFGQVWHANRAGSNERVAIKILHLELVRSIDALTRFQRELDAIQRLQHPNVVRALDHGTLSDGRPFLILEYLEGPSLREVIAERGAIPPHDALAILEPLCDALAMAHDAGLVHRDVKASNVILAATDGVQRPVLLDFGLVKLVDQQGPGLTSSRSMLGTPAAMAPEQMRGQAVDARTDVYALGLLAYHMLTGQPAFGGAPGVVQSYLQVHGPRPRPSAKVDIDPAIDEPVARALAPDPADRFPSTRALLEAMRAVIAPVDGAELDVIAVYLEGAAAAIPRALEIVRERGLVVAMTAPDSVLAVAPRDRSDVAGLRVAFAGLSSVLRIAIGCSRATICGPIVDGPALDVEGWAPYPLPAGLWISADIVGLATG